MLLQHSQSRAECQAHWRRQVPGRDCALELYLFGIVVIFFSFQAAVSTEQQVIFDEINQEDPTTTAHP